MSELNPCNRAKEITKQILLLCQKEGLMLDEVEDIPAELQREISRSISDSKKNTRFTCRR